MSTLRIPVSRACQQRCGFCAVADELDGRPIEAAPIREAILRAQRDGIRRVVFTGGEPTLSRHLVKAIGFAHGLGLETGIATNGRFLDDPEKLGRLVAAELTAVYLALHGADAETHNALTGGDPIAFDKAMGALAACTEHFETTLRTVLTRDNRHQIADLVRLASTHGARFDLRRIEPVGAATHGHALAPSASEAWQAWHIARNLAHELGVPFASEGFERLSRFEATVDPTPAIVDEARLEILAAGAVDTAALSGLTSGGVQWERVAEAVGVREPELAYVLAGRRAPRVDLSPHLGGAGTLEPGHHPLAWTPIPEGAKVAVVVSPDTPALVAGSVFPGLVNRLVDAGVDAHLFTPFASQVDLDSLTPATSRGMLGRVRDLLPRTPTARWGGDGSEVPIPSAKDYLRGLELDSVRLVLTWGVRPLSILRRHGVDADAIVIDDGMLEGLTEPWRPADRLISPWPSRTRAYLLAQVPMSCVHWRPLPFWLPHLPDGHDPSLSSEVYVCRADGSDEATRALREPQSAAAIVESLESLARARFVQIDPLTGSKVDPWFLSLCTALGRPVLGTQRDRLIDHLRPDAAHLVEIDDADAFANAREALLADDDRIRAMAEAARSAAPMVGVQRLAQELVAGAPHARVVSPTAHGPWWPW